MAKKRFNIKGMHCKSCEMLIEDILTEEGVDVLAIDHKQGFVDVNFDDKKITSEKIVSLIKAEGYEVSK